MRENDCRRCEVGWKRFVFVLMLGVLALGCGPAKFNIVSVTEPVDVQVGREATIHVQLDRNVKDLKGKQVVAKLTGLAGDQSSSLVGAAADKAAFELKFTPQVPAQARKVTLVLEVDGKQAATKPLTLDAMMPAFYQPDQSYLEMVTSPDSSIYGSHITVWNALGDTELLTVTGHASSRVCRTASAAMFSLAQHTNSNSDSFVLGAGVGCLDVRGIETEVKSLEEKLKACVPGVYKLANDTLRKLVSQETTDDASIRLPISEQENSKIALSLLINLVDTISQESSDYSRPALSADRKRLLELTELASQGERLSPEQRTALISLLTNLDQSVAALRFVYGEDLEPVIDAFASLPDETKREAMAIAERLGAMRAALNTAIEDLSELSESSGLVSFADSTSSTVNTVNHLDQIKQSIGKWVQGSANGSSTELSRLASGHRGCILLPLYDEHGKSIEFRIDNKLLEATEGQAWREAMRSSTAGELSRIAQEAANRRRENASDSKRLIAEFLADYRSGKEAFAAKYETKKVEREIQLVDGRGRKIGVKHVFETEVEVVLGQLDFLANTNRDIDRFVRMAEASGSASKSDKFQSMSDACMIDSLLRGWKLSFSDDEVEKKFETWTKEARSAAWNAIGSQAEQRGIDLSQIANEGTVFQVRPVEDGFRVIPLCVCDLSRSSCVRSGRFAYYTDPWFSRTTLELESAAAPEQEKESQERAQSPADLTQDSMKNLDSWINDEIDRIFALEQLEERLQAVDAFQEMLVEDKRDEILLALSASPETAVAHWSESLLTMWPREEALRISRDSFKDLENLTHFYGLQGDEQKDYILTQTMEGTWPFPEEYADFIVRLTQAVKKSSEEAVKTPSEGQRNSDQPETVSDVRTEELKKLAELLKKNLNEVDPQFMENMDTNPEYVSDKRRQAVMLQNRRDTANMFQSLALLAEASHRLEEWDDRGYVVLETDRLLKDGKSVAEGELTKLLETLDHQLQPFDDGSDEQLLRTHATEVCTTLKAIAQQLNGNLKSETHWRLSERAERLSALFGRAFAENETDSNRHRVCQAIDEAVQCIVATSPSRLSNQENLAELLNGLKSRVSSEAFDALDRQTYRHELSEISDQIIQTVVPQLKKEHERNAKRRTEEMLIQLDWYSGNYRPALARLTNGAFRRSIETCLEGLTEKQREDFEFAMERPLRSRSSRQQAVAWLNDKSVWQAYLTGLIVQSYDSEILKACVYSGGEFFGTSLFGRRSNDWVKKPQNVQQVVREVVTRDTRTLERTVDRDLHRLYDDALANRYQPNGEKLGEYRVLDTYRSFTDIRAFKVKDSTASESIVKVIKRDAAGTNLEQMVKGVEITDYLARQGVRVPNMLPIGKGRNPKVHITSEVVVTRETVAAGRQMSELLKEHGKLPDSALNSYIEATLDIGIKGKELPDSIALKPGLRDHEAMMDKMLQRGEMAKDNFDIFFEFGGAKERLGAEAQSHGDQFYSLYETFVTENWAGARPIQELALVHDANLRNYFIEGDKVTIIDVSDDYVGSVGHNFSIMLGQLKGNRAPGYEGFKQQYESLKAAYQEKIGRALTRDQEAEIVLHMPFHPFKFISSDSRVFIEQIKREFRVTTDAELRAALADPANRNRLQSLLNDSETLESYQQHVEQLEHSLRLLQEKYPEASGVEELRSKVEELKTLGLRLAVRSSFHTEIASHG